MSVLDCVHDVQLHREVYIAQLKSVLREPGSKRRLSQHIGVTPQYLSYLLNPGTDASSSVRTPSMNVAEKIATTLPLESEQRDQLLKHMYLAHEKASLWANALHSECLSGSIDELVKELQAAHQQATFARDPHVAKRYYLMVRDTSTMLLEHRLLYTYPFNTIEVCMLLHDAQCVLNCPAEALYWAKLARAILTSRDRSEYRDKERFDRYCLQTLRAEAVAYNNLHLYQEAYDCCLQAEQSDAMCYQAPSCIPHLNRDKLKALAGRSRFSLYEAEALVTQVRTVCDRGRDNCDPLWVFLAQRYLGRAYLRQRNLKKARKLLRTLLEQVETIPHLGPLHQTMFFKTYAQLCWEEGNMSEWEYALRRALTSTVHAGLIHQLDGMKHVYGQAVFPLLEELGVKQ